MTTTEKTPDGTTTGGETTAPTDEGAVLAGSRLVPRFGLPDDIAAMAAFLGAPDGSYITGQVFAIDGGRSIL